MNEMAPATRSTDPLFQPLTIKRLTLKNRIMSTSHAISYGQDGFPQERYQAYHEEKAKGGLALTMFGGSSVVAPDSPPVFGQLDVSTDAVVPHFQRFAERIHAHGAALMCQITHAGRRTTHQGGSWLPPVAPSRAPGDLYGALPKEIDKADIDRIIRAYGQAARRCWQGGLDGCELIATGHLPDQFWTPRVNRRSDEWGGSLENRTRFSRAVLEEMRAATGPDFVLSLRMSMVEALPGGLGPAECLEIAQMHAEAGLVDVLNLTHGSVDTAKTLAEYMPGMAAGLSPFVQVAGRFRAQLGVPVFHATRINDLATARHAIAEGLVDMVGMTRAHIADPHLVAKLARGEDARIRPCVGATYCSSWRQCIHNAATGREAHLPHIVPSAPARRRAVVVGGGPGGMEAARVLGARGHDVVLFEAADRLGGQIRIAERAGWRRDLGGIADWLESELAVLGTDLRFGVLADADTVQAEDPDIVVVATGGLPDTGWIDGDAEVLSTWDVLTGPPLEGEVLVHDALGQQQALSAAERLAETARVEITTPERMIGHAAPKLDVPTFQKNLYANGVRMTPDHHLIRADRQNNRIRAVLRSVATGQDAERIVDHVVVERGTLPNDAVWRGLAPRARNGGDWDVDAAAAWAPQPDPGGDGPLVYRVGDALASRDIHAAILDSLRLCKDL